MIQPQRHVKQLQSTPKAKFDDAQIKLSYFDETYLYAQRVNQEA